MHHRCMRTHKDIIKSTGAQAVIDRAGLTVTVHTVRSWQQRDGIPGEYWAALDRAGVASLAELAHAADARRVAANDATAQERAA